MMFLYGADIGTLTLALLLEQHGIEYCLFDPRPTLEKDDENCDPPLHRCGAVILYPPALDLLIQLGLRDEVWFESHPLLQVEVFERRHWALHEPSQEHGSLRSSNKKHSSNSLPTASDTQATCMNTRGFSALSCATTRLSPSMTIDPVGHLDFSRWRSHFDSVWPLDCRVIDRAILTDILLSQVPVHRIQLSKSLRSIHPIPVPCFSEEETGTHEHKDLREILGSNQDSFSSDNLLCRFDDGSEARGMLLVASHVGDNHHFPKNVFRDRHDSVSQSIPTPQQRKSNPTECSEKQRLSFDDGASSSLTSTSTSTLASPHHHHHHHEATAFSSFPQLSSQPRRHQTCERVSPLPDNRAQNLLACEIELPPRDLHHCEYIYVVVEGVTDSVDPQRFPLVRDESAHFRLVVEDVGGFSWSACTLVDHRIAWQVNRRIHFSEVEASCVVSCSQGEEYATKHEQHHPRQQQYAALQERILGEFADLPCPLGACMSDLFKYTPASGMNIRFSELQDEPRVIGTDSVPVIQLVGGNRLPSTLGEDVDFSIMEAHAVSQMVYAELAKGEFSPRGSLTLAKAARQQQRVLHQRYSSWYKRIDQFLESQTLWQRLRRWLALNFMPPCMQDRLDEQRLLDVMAVNYVDAIS